MTIDTGDTACVLASASLVLLMTPGLALFYGGMVRAKSVLNMMMMSFGAMATIGVTWVLWGYSEAFGNSWRGLIANSLKTIDFAGGTAVHINAGAAGLALALILGKRVGFAKDPMRPHNMTLVMLGAALLWFGWFGFNAGSALGANNTAAVTWVNTMAATAAACIGWLATERIRNGHATSLGAASGIVAGLVAITPACSAVTPLGAVAIGILAGVLCALAVGLKFRLGFDDSLDVVGVHLVGGLVGTIAIGFFASASAPAAVDGLFYGGGFDQLWRQVVGAGAVLLYSFVATTLIGLALHKILGFRIERDAEVSGIDIEEHAETSYDLGSLGGGGVSHAGAAMFGSHTMSSATTSSTATNSTATAATPNRQGA